MRLIIGGAYQGKTEYAKRTYGEEAEVLNGLHLRIREWMENGREPLEEIKDYVKKHPEAVIICDEIGCGVVPVDFFMREYREKTGRITCYLAKEAQEVIRVMCGIGTIIKKDEV